jgi:hypothetical protein
MRDGVGPGRPAWVRVPARLQVPARLRVPARLQVPARLRVPARPLGRAGRAACAGALVVATVLTLAACDRPPEPKRSPSAAEAVFARTVETNLSTLGTDWWRDGDSAVVNESRLRLILGADMGRSDVVNVCRDIGDRWADIASGQPGNVSVKEIWVETTAGEPQAVQCAMVVPKP